MKPGNLQNIKAGKRRRPFSITFFDTEFSNAAPKEWVFQWRYGREPDSKHKTTITAKQESWLGKQEDKTSLLLADFLFHYYQEVRGVEGSSHRFTYKVESYYSFLVADFDVLPKGFRKFSSLRAYLMKKYPGAFILETPSKKAKALFLIKQDLKADKSSHGKRWAALGAIFNEERLIRAVDPRPVSIHRCFFTQAMLRELTEQKNEISISIFGRASELSASFEKTEACASIKGGEKEIPSNQKSQQQNQQPSSNEKLVFDESSSETPNSTSITRDKVLWARKLLLKDNCRGLSKCERQVLSYLLLVPYLNHKADISQRSVASTLGIGIASVSRSLTSLIEKKKIERTGDGYVAGEKSLSYKLICQDLIKVHMAIHYYKSLPRAPEFIEIPDGEWNDRLFLLTKSFRTEASYIQYVKEIPGFNAKAERLSQAHAAWRSHQRRKVQSI